MSREEAVALLHRLAARVRRQAGLRLFALVLAGGLPVVGGLGVLLDWPAGGRLGGGLVVAVIGAAWSFGAVRRAGIDAGQVAVHLDRTTPSLEESTTLLLQPETALPVLGRLQQLRVLDALHGLPEPPDVAVPGFRLAGALGALAVLLSLGLAAWQGDVGESRPAPIVLRGPGGGALPEGAAVRVESAQVTVIPPGYTGRPPATTDGLAVEALEGAEAIWEITFTRRVAQPFLVFNDGDTLILAPAAGTTFRAQRILQASGFYYLASGPGEAEVFRSDYFPLTVIEDMPPVVTVLQPQARTVIEPGEPARVALAVQVDDDLGVAAAHLVATVSKGTGEGVKFREQTLDFTETRKTTRTAWSLSRTLDLNALGMEAGDELYFFVVAQDGRRPVPNRGRSETFFVVLRDTVQGAEVAADGLVLNPVEAYLRSQRQIIIDTEKLIAEKKGIDRVAFVQRSNDLGIDQKVLRLRYGQFLGEEFESGVAEPGDEDHHEDADVSSLGEPGQAAGALRNQFAHRHDTEEGATFYADEIKSSLKAVLAQMWEAELRLRTGRTQEALPYEYEALRLLKALQQKARIYVKRIGFEPPPLKPDERRLTGDLDEVRSRRRRQAKAAVVSFPAIRNALAVLERLASGQDGTTASLDVLESAGRELAGVAVKEPGRYLPALQNLRTLIEELEAGRPACPSCLASVRQAFWNVLPVAEAFPGQQPGNGTSLARRYFNALGR